MRSYASRQDAFIDLYSTFVAFFFITLVAISCLIIAPFADGSWCSAVPATFDGVLVFDECHKAKNFREDSEAGTKIGMGTAYFLEDSCAAFVCLFVFCFADCQSAFAFGH